ncbi:MAG: radical SAM protein [Myxococcales bacterium]|nr:radical SAM protein [Myxococcales bacterium]
MRVALLYPPPWKVAAAGAPPYLNGEGPPDGYRDGDLDADFHQIPYGLLALGAGVIRAGHQVKVMNLSGFEWPKVETVVSGLDAEVFGLSCWTANRRGVRYVTELIKAHHPGALVVVGGPHATPLAPELLRHYASVDAVCTGESDETLLELIAKRAAGQPLAGTPGAWVRENGHVSKGPERASIRNLDDLECVQRHFATHILMTSRGCPWACTFCGAETSWGRGFRANSVDYVVDAMASALERLPVKMIQIKDDTFTTNKKRVVELCRAIRARGLNFLWSCDTRVDLLTDELLKEMRLAGCQRLSLGVESGSQRILDAIEKKITVQEILTSTELAKRYGIKVRYYMMLGNRGETAESFAETLGFLQRAKPHEYIFSCLSVYPGTKDFQEAEKTWLDRDVFFREAFQELKTPFDAPEDVTALLNSWFKDNSGLRTAFRETTADYEAILGRLGDHHAAHMDLGAAYYHEGRFDDAERHIKRALDLSYPAPGLVYNHLACIAKARGDLDLMMEHFTTAAKLDPQHWILIQNVQRARAWFKDGGPGRGLPLELLVRHDFQLLERTMQPTLPGPLPDDLATWDAPAAPREGATFVKTPEMEGSGKGLLGRKLKVVS